MQRQEIPIPRSAVTLGYIARPYLIKITTTKNKRQNKTKKKKGKKI
jgi:hypothetical protein